MATLSYDGQSFIIDGRRIWLVSGAIHYARVPRELWRSRIRDARQAGLNCIVTHVFWNIHEPRPRKFCFEGDADLRHFVQLIGEEDMYCILRPGPFVGTDWDFGGLPGWLNAIEDMRLRQHNRPFLEAAARYIGAVTEQVRDLQVVSPGGGPIVLFQAENEWYCQHPGRGEAYLGEIARFCRENGCQVPIILANNLWQRAEGTIDTWVANEHLAADLRQLRLVQPDAPRLVSAYRTGRTDHWSKRHAPEGDARALIHDLAQILASGSQFNLQPFHGGTNFAFHGGRNTGSPAAFVTTSYDCDAPLREGGSRGDRYDAVKQISTFASQFAHVFAHLDPNQTHTAVAPGPDQGGVSVIQQRGTQGGVVFLLKGEADETTQIDLLLPEGLTLPVPIGHARVAWVLIGANLAGEAELTYANLRPWAFIQRRMLVFFGLAGAEGIVCINGAPLRLTVPRNGAVKPFVQEVEGLTVVVLNEAQVNASYPTANGLVVGAGGLGPNDEPLPLTGWTSRHVIGLNGRIRTSKTTTVKRPAAPRLSAWQQATPSDLLSGESDQFRSIDGPHSLEVLATALCGYGWYRMELDPPGRQKVMAPRSGDRLHLYHDGRLVGLWGVGPGACNEPAKVEAEGRIVVLANCLGRFCEGWRLGEPAGLADHLYAVRPVTLGRPKIIEVPAPDAAEFGDAYMDLRYGDRPPARTMIWKFKPAVRNHMVLDIQGLPLRAMILVNKQPVGVYDPLHSAGFFRRLLEFGKDIGGGQNELRLALLAEPKGEIPLKALKLYQCTQVLTASNAWGFATWEEPEGAAFGPLSGSNLPCWYRCRFDAPATDAPLWLEPTGLSKGQIFINGHNAGRYFLATGSGRSVGPQKRYYLPQPWLRTDGPNVLSLFEEHGKSPERCGLVHAKGPFDP